MLSIFFSIPFLAPFVVQHPDAEKKRYDDPAKKDELICANAFGYVMSGWGSCTTYVAISFLPCLGK